MDDRTLIQELRRLACRDNLQCFGCGREHGCSLHGCAIIKEAATRLEQLTAPKPNDPLTLEELREMDGEPVWVIWKNREEWAIIHHCQPPETLGRAFVMVMRSAAKYFFQLSDYGTVWLAYRRKPEEAHREHHDCDADR